MGKRIAAIDESSLTALGVHLGGGNVRELRNVVERAIILSGEGTLRIERPHPRAKAGAVSQMLEDVDTDDEVRHPPPVLTSQISETPPTFQRRGVYSRPVPCPVTGKCSAWASPAATLAPEAGHLASLQAGCTAKRTTRDGIDGDRHPGDDAAAR
jgi:hypothetical protein